MKPQQPAPNEDAAGVQRPTESMRVVKRDFDTNGYVALSGFLSVQEVAELCREIDRYIAEVVPRLPPSEVFYEIKGRPETLKQMQRMFHHDEWFARLVADACIVGLAESLLGEAVVGRNLQWFNKPPGVGQPTPPHQDGYYFMLDPPAAVTMWLALDDVDEGNGCVRYVKGSQHHGVRAHTRTDTLGFSQGIADYGSEDQCREVAMPAKPGDLLAHHALTIHRADGNRSSNRTRRALGFIYYGASAREDAERAALYRARLTAQWEREGKL